MLIVFDLLERNMMCHMLMIANPVFYLAYSGRIFELG
jgi:hypothetical protein